jgi:hypothetical protein
MIYLNPFQVTGMYGVWIMALDRDRIVSEIVDMVRRDIEFLIYSGKDPEGVADLMTHTLGSMRALARRLKDSTDPRAKMLTRGEIDECRAMRDALPDDFSKFMWDSAIASGAHPVSISRRLRDAVLAGIESEDDDGSGPVSHGM